MTLFIEYCSWRTVLCCCVADYFIINCMGSCKIHACLQYLYFVVIFNISNLVPPPGSVSWKILIGTGQVHFMAVPSKMYRLEILGFGEHNKYIPKFLHLIWLRIICNLFWELADVLMQWWIYNYKTKRSQSYWLDNRRVICSVYLYFLFFI